MYLEEHRRLLADLNRLAAFRKAIGEVVKSGDVVVDLGSGTGILGLFACRAGAAKIYSIEQGDIIHLAREIAKANGVEDRIVFVQNLSTRTTLPEKVDVVLGDLTGQFGWEGGILEFYSDARARFLKQSGTLIPSRLTLFVAAVESQELWRDRILFWDNILPGFDFEPLQTLAVNTAYSCQLRKENIVTQPVTVNSWSLYDPIPQSFELRMNSFLDREATVCGLAGWFESQLSKSVRITNSPLVEDRVKRPQVFFPLTTPIVAKKGSPIRAKIEIVPEGPSLGWEIECDGRKDSHTSKPGKDWTPGSSPALSNLGKALLDVLSLLHDGRTIGQVQDDIQTRYPDLFPTRKAADEFVRNVSHHYSQIAVK